MSHHGEGPKIVYVRAYSRWVKVELRRVESSFRAVMPPLILRYSSLQLDFGFMHSGPT